MAIIYAAEHYRQYPTGRRLTLVTDCSALTCLFRSGDPSAKLHQ